MDWLQNHLGSMGYLGDYYIPQSSGGGSGASESKRIAGEEQIRKKAKDLNPVDVYTEEYGYPRLQKFFEWEQFLDYVDWSGKEHRRRSHWTGQMAKKHTMTWNFEEAMNLARYGWREGLEKAKNLEKIDFQITETFQQNYDIKTQYNVAGGAVNIGRYLSGMPDCMRCMHISNYHSLPARIQKVFIISDYAIDTNPNEILQHGYKVYQIINALEMANIQTDITLAFGVNKWCMYYQNDYDFYETYINIKKTEDVIYPEKMIFCVAHPSMFRRLVFSEEEKNSYFIREKFHFHYDDGEFGYGKHVKSWKPPYPMTKGALVIPRLDQKEEMEHLMNKVQRLIQSQYDKIM